MPKNWQIIALVPGGYIEIEPQSGRYREALFDAGQIPKPHRMGVTIGKKKSPR